MTEEKNYGIFKKIFSTKVYLWIVVLIAIIIAVTYLVGALNGSKEDNNSKTIEMVQYLEKADEHVFLNIGIEKVLSDNNDTKIFGTKHKLPFSEKTALVVLNYEAKLGVKQSIVPVKNGDKEYEITIPKYEVIGIKLNEKEPYTLYNRDAEILSVLTDEVDTGKLTADNLSNAEQEKYIDKYKESLNQSVEEYFTALFMAIDKDIKLSFNFPE